MRFTVTALGSAGGRPVSAVVGDIAEYLLGTGNDPEVEGDPGAEGPDRYYADAGEGPGRWLGQGADEMGLVGEVGGGEFRSVLGGRNPFTGERLISARGSAGRVDQLGAGSATRWSEEGEALYGIADAAAVLGWSPADVADAVAEGERVAAGHLFGTVALTGGSDSNGDDPGMGLVPVIDRDGSRLIPDGELSRVETLVNESRSAEGVLAGGDAEEELTASTAARLVGTSPSYLTRLCRAYEEHRVDIDAAATAGAPSRRSYLVARRDGAGEWRIRRDDLAAYTQRRRQPAVRVGYDVTATTEKSFSVLALLGGPRARHEVLAAIETANDTGLAWLEQHAASARAGGEVVGVTGWTAASFRHLTSRRLDPFVHHHNVVANTVVDEHGQRRALDARRLYRSITAASALATAQARYELAARLGVGFRAGPRGGWEIDGITDPVVDEFSQRTREIRDTVRELEASLGRSTSLAEFQAVVAGSRPAKEAVADESAVLAGWWQRAEVHGLTPEGLAGCLDRHQPTPLTARRRGQVLVALESAVTGERSVFSQGDVLAALVDLPAPDGTGPLVVPAATLEALADEFLTSDRVVALATSSGRHDVLIRQDGTTVAVGGEREVEYTTTEILAVQTLALDAYAATAGVGRGQVPDRVVTAALARFPELAAEQRNLVEAFCTSGDGAQSAVGQPGTGKTHAMRAAVAAWTDAGYRVLGTAVKAEAARHLGGECGIPAEPLAWYINRLDDRARSPLDARTVLVVDEASTVGDRDLAALIAAAARDGAAVRLIGDPAQHGAVTAGGLWRVVTERLPDRTPQLTVGRRVRHHGDHAAAEALRAGRAADALAALEAAGHLHIVDDERDLYVQLLTRWWTARQAGAPHPMVDRRNDQRLVLNRLARVLRRQLGGLDDAELRAAGDRRYSAGDEVVARMGDRQLHPAERPEAYVRNGARGTVIAVATGDDPVQDRLVVEFDGLGAIVLPRAFFDEHTDGWGRTDVGIDHAYAVTSYAVEGLTYGESSSHVDPQSTRPEVYVDITRGRHANHVFVTRAEELLAGEQLPAVPGETERRQLEQRLARSGTEPAAVDLDPLAGPAALHARGRTLAELTRERAAAGDPAARELAARAEAIRERQIARRAVSRPDPHLAVQLVERPREAFLAARHDQLLADMAIYRARWEPRPGRTGPWVWALGQVPADPGGAADRDQLIARLEQHAAEVVRRRLEPDTTLAGPARDVVRHLAATGALGRADLDRLAATWPAGDAGTAEQIGQLLTGFTRPAATRQANGEEIGVA